MRFNEAAMVQFAKTGHIELYSGSRPDRPGDALDEQIMLANGFMSLSRTVEELGHNTSTFVIHAKGIATGHARWFRVVAADHVTPLFDGRISNRNDGADLVLNTLDIHYDQPVEIDFTIHY